MSGGAGRGKAIGLRLPAALHEEALAAARAHQRQHARRPVTLDHEGVGDVARQEDERAWPGGVVLAVVAERHLTLEHVERLVLALVDVERGEAPGAIVDSTSPYAPSVVSALALSTIRLWRNQVASPSPAPSVYMPAMSCVLSCRSHLCNECTDVYSHP